MEKQTPYFLSLFLLFSLFFSCIKTPSPKDSLNIAVTSPAIGKLVEELGGDKVVVNSLSHKYSDLQHLLPLRHYKTVKESDWLILVGQLDSPHLENQTSLIPFWNHSRWQKLLKEKPYWIMTNRVQNFKRYFEETISETQTRTIQQEPYYKVSGLDSNYDEFLWLDPFFLSQMASLITYELTKRLPEQTEYFIDRNEQWSTTWYSMLQRIEVAQNLRQDKKTILFYLDVVAYTSLAKLMGIKQYYAESEALPFLLKNLPENIQFDYSLSTEPLVKDIAPNAYFDPWSREYYASINDYLYSVSDTLNSD